MHSMSGAAAAGGDHGGQLYGDHHPAAAGFLPLYHDDDVDRIFFQGSACGSGGAGGEDVVDVLTPYSSIADYLQGFLDPAGLARHFDASSSCQSGDAAADAVKRELAVVDVGHDGRLQVGGAAAVPVTPNSSALSSTSSEAAAGEEDEPRQCKKGRTKEEEEGEVDEEGSADHQSCRRKAKMKKKGEKKPREPRVAFMTKSQVDHLEDGFRWRKYGQKAVKNSSYPRSYYRCTAARCGVKKQVERSHQDPSTVITTYEGHHTHPCPVSHRGVPGAACMLMAGRKGCSLAAPAPASLQHGFCPDDALAARARVMSPVADLYARIYTPRVPAAATAPVHLPQAEHSFANYYGLQDLPSSVMGDQHA